MDEHQEEEWVNEPTNAFQKSIRAGDRRLSSCMRRWATTSSSTGTLIGDTVKRTTW